MLELSFEIMKKDYKTEKEVQPVEKNVMEI